jgi:hypothetical protein
LTNTPGGRKTVVKTTIFSVFMLLTAAGAYCQAEELVIARIQGHIEIDGVCDDDAWAQATVVPLGMYLPFHGGEPTEDTDFLIGFDDQYLYLGGRLYCRNGAEVRSVSRKRDSFDQGNDYFGILLDTYNDNENALGFLTNPAGVRVDFAVFNDAEPRGASMPFSESWNTYWDARTRETAEGWHAEVRIPLSSLRFQTKDGGATMGLIAWRYIASKVEMQVFPLMPNDRGIFSEWKPSSAQKVFFPGIRNQNPLYIVPYLLTGYEYGSELNSDHSAWVGSNTGRFDAGLDAKYNLSAELTLDLTVNTDFAQVEADDQQVNLSRFDLFYPEKRQFFLERSSNFDFNSGGPNTLFYSRRIGLHEEEIVPIYGGVRLVGRTGGWDLGLLNMQTAPATGVASTNFGVLRARRQVFNPFSYLGAIVTSKLGTDGSYNTVYGADGIFRLWADNYFSANYAQTFGPDLACGAFRLSNAKLYLNWENRRERGVLYVLSASRTGVDYHPEMGYEWREDYGRIYGKAGYGWILPGHPYFMKIRALTEAYAYRRNTDGALETLKAGPAWEFVSKKSFWGRVSVNYNYEDLHEPLELPCDVWVPVGSYDFASFETMFETPGNALFSGRGQTYLGSFFDGRRVSVMGTMFFKPSALFQASLQYQFEDAVFDDRSEHLRLHIAGVRGEITFSTRLMLSAFLQYNSADRIGVDNIRLRYNPREGTDLWLVYSDAINTDRFREIPTLPAVDSRLLLLKFNHSFRLIKKSGAKP